MSHILGANILGVSVVGKFYKVITVTVKYLTCSSTSGIARYQL